MEDNKELKEYLLKEIEENERLSQKWAQKRLEAKNVDSNAFIVSCQMENYFSGKKTVYRELLLLLK